MPELPEVETTKQGLTPLLQNRLINNTIVHQPQLRLLIPENFSLLIQNKSILSIKRRSKYLIFKLSSGSLIIHLGMSGHLRVDAPDKPLKKHDHIELILDNNNKLRYHDPRRFGLWVYTSDTPESHRLLANLGPEPLSTNFSQTYLYNKTRGKKQPIKNFIMDNNQVVGVGNIYASESLFLSRLNPLKAAGLLTFKECYVLVKNIRLVLKAAISAGGTTLKDFYSTDGSPGYFAIHLKVYGRAGLNCYSCQDIIKNVKLAGRQSAFCPTCQPEP